MSRRVGRPAVKRDPNERVPLATRVRGEIYNKLIEAAHENDRPLGSEIELLIESAWRLDEITGSLRLLLPVISAFDRAGTKYAKESGVAGDWRDDPAAFRYAYVYALEELVNLDPGPWDGEIPALSSQAFLKIERRKGGAK